MPSAQGVRAGRAFVELFADDSRLVRGLKSAQRKLQAFGRAVTGMGTRLLGIGTLAAGPLAFAIKAASDLEETMNKFRVVFGENADAVKAWGDGLAEQVGRSREQIARFLAGSQDLLVPIGIDPAAATEMSKSLTKLAIDLASFNNVSDADAMRDLQAALTGSSETMKKYGVVVNETAVKQELLNQGIEPKNASEAQKAVARLNLILRGTQAAQGDATRSAGSFANQMKALRARVFDAAATFGSQLLPVVTPLVTKLVDGLKVIAAWIKANPELARTILVVTASVIGAGLALTVLGTIISGLGTVIGLVITVLTALASLLTAILSPIGLVTAAVVGGVAAFFTWSETGRKAAHAVGQAFLPLGRKLAKAFDLVKRAIKQGRIADAWRFVTSIMGILWEELIEAMKSAWNGFMRHVLKGLAKLTELPIEVFGQRFVTRLSIQLKEMANDFVQPADEVFLDPKTGKPLPADRQPMESVRRRMQREERFAKAVAELEQALKEGAGDLDEDVRDAMDELKEAKPPEFPEFELPKGGLATDDLKSSVVGTFNAFAVRGFARGNVQERIAKAAEETAKNTKRMLRGPVPAEFQ